jgi:peptide chain release factor 2
MQEKNYIEKDLEGIFLIEDGLKDNSELLEIATEENDQQMILEIKENLDKIAKIAQNSKISCLFSGENDKNDCFLEINTGVGGSDACDFADMLLRMYHRWAENHEFKVEIISYLAGDEAGIKSATMRISGYNAYGWSRTESGVHRLVRISPFNANGKRQTSFASVWIYPVIDDKIEIEIDDKDLRIDTYRASGAGGQHVNKTDSAVRITHIPTNIVVQCQNDRSQLRNRAEAMKMLKSRLFELEMRKRQDEKDESNATKTDNGWGNQIRSYVLHPYKMVKDLRTNVEHSNPQAVLDGDLDSFILSNLQKGAEK